MRSIGSAVILDEAKPLKQGLHSCCQKLGREVTVIARNSRVRVSANGQTKAVQDLAIGGFVYNPISHQYVEICDILARVVEFNNVGKNHGGPLRPLTVKTSAFGHDLPSCTVTVSPKQWIAVANQSVFRQGKKSALEIRTADHHESEITDILPSSAPLVEYFAVFTTSKTLIDVSGLLLLTYDNSIFSPTAELKSYSQAKRPKVLS